MRRTSNKRGKNDLSEDESVTLVSESDNTINKSNEHIPDGNGKRKLFHCAKIGIGIGIGVLVVTLLIAFVPPLNGWFWETSCGLGIKISGYDTLATDKYHLWYNYDSTMQLAQTGTFVGPSQMTEYVDFIRAIYFDKYDVVGGKTRWQTASKDRCVLEIASHNKVQVKPEYSTTGKGECILTTVGIRLDYTVGLFGFGFNIKKITLFYPELFLNILFNDMIGGEGVTDYICGTVLRDSCQDVYEANGLNDETCKKRYNNLPQVDLYGYLDDKAKGCRILHSAFAEINEKHCPHMSFIPIKDYAGDLWCQKSGGVKAEDLFSESELKFFKDYAIDLGYDPETLSAPCDYEPV